MKAIQIMFDSLNRRHLSPYNPDIFSVDTPNFARLAQKATTFDEFFVGSMPCIPARRELHTGRYNFLHRSWGPLEPFDDSVPEMLRNNGVHTHLISDHQHYWEDGGATYHHRYSTWQYNRGQEGDRWKGKVSKPTRPETHKGHWVAQDAINREYITEEHQTPMAQTFEDGLEFLNTNYQEDKWFLQIETFDPHEPFFSLNEWKKEDLKTSKYTLNDDWPYYDKVTEDEEYVKHMNLQYESQIKRCDHYLGKILDFMDEKDMWKDTMLIINTDHGYMLGEHDWWAKVRQPFFNEIAHAPFFMYLPDSGKEGEHNDCLVQTIDIPVTLLDWFGLKPTSRMEGHSLIPVLKEDKKCRDHAIFGMFGGHVNLVNKDYIYMKGGNKTNSPLYEYTLMPCHKTHMFAVDELQETTMHPPFDFTQGCPVMRIPGRLTPDGWYTQFETFLYDRHQDPKQDKPMRDKKVEKELDQILIQMLKDNDAPKEQFERLELL